VERGSRIDAPLYLNLGTDVSKTEDPSRNPGTLLADLENFIHDHRPHGPLTADASAPAWNGYQLTVACPCGVVFQRWATPEDAELDLLHFASLN
jgi:hypothetical protein